VAAKDTRIHLRRCLSDDPLALKKKIEETLAYNSVAAFRDGPRYSKKREKKHSPTTPSLPFGTEPVTKKEERRNTRLQLRGCLSGRTPLLKKKKEETLAYNSVAAFRDGPRYFAC
jgi:hypothetical protein